MKGINVRDKVKIMKGMRYRYEKCDVEKMKERSGEGKIDGNNAR